jgi:hypothetical protein
MKERDFMKKIKSKSSENGTSMTVTEINGVFEEAGRGTFLNIEITGYEPFTLWIEAKETGKITLCNDATISLSGSDWVYSDGQIESKVTRIQINSACKSCPHVSEDCINIE